jgi:PAS domain S-box-containing protein
MNDRARTPARAVLEALLAPALAGLALVLRKLLPIEPGVGLYPLPLTAIIVGAWLGGRLGGLLATAVAGLGIAFWFLAPARGWAALDADQLVGFGIFVAAAILATEMSSGFRRTQQALRESESRLRQVAETSPGVIWMMGLDPAEVLYVNPCYARIWGEAADALWQPPIRWPRAVHPEDQARVRDVFDEWLTGRTGDELELEYRIVRPDGGLRWIHERDTLIRSPSGAVVRATGIAHDVTARVEAEEGLRQAQSHLERLNRASTMGELAAALAHEIRQPIAAALTDARTCVRWLERTPPELDEARAAAGRAAADATRAAEIVTRIRSLFQKAAPQRAPVEVNAVVREVMALLRGEARRHAVTVRAELAPGLPPVAADAVQLQQVLVNLAQNALQAVCEVDGPREVTLSTARDGAGCRVSVIDTGPGLAAGQLERIFEAFYSTKPDGTGMGLPISRSIVEAHGGRLWAEPAPRPDGHGPARGLAVRFTLPAEGGT